MLLLPIFVATQTLRLQLQAAKGESLVFAKQTLPPTPKRYRLNTTQILTHQSED
jgi:hypothetical protein